jgi:flagellar protein FliO/FliZ
MRVAVRPAASAPEDSMFDTPTAVKVFVAFVVVFALIGVAAWVVRRFGPGALTQSRSGRQPRLAVIEASAVDARRRLVLIRRDNVEHLLLIGGPSDVVVEPNIVRAQAAVPRDATLPRAAVEPRPMPLPLAEPSSWPAPEIPARAQRATPAAPTAEEAMQWPLPEAAPAPRKPRAVEPHPAESFVAEARDIEQRAAVSRLAEMRAPEPRIEPRAAELRMSEPRGAETRMPATPPMPSLAPATEASTTESLPVDPLAGLARELAIDLEPMPAKPNGHGPSIEPAMPVAPQAAAPAPPVVPPVPPAPPADAAADHNLAEMAQRLEAALRRPLPAGPRPAPLKATPDLRAPTVAPEAPEMPLPVSDKAAAPRVEPKLESAKTDQTKNVFGSLEREMASLLGRTPGKP